jgi:hypothetical protein
VATLAESSDPARHYPAFRGSPVRWGQVSCRVGMDEALAVPVQVPGREPPPPGHRRCGG